MGFSSDWSDSIAEKLSPETVCFADAVVDYLISDES